MDDVMQAYYEQFPPDPPGMNYCQTCSLRTPTDCSARQRFWIERDTPRNTAADV